MGEGSKAASVMLSPMMTTGFFACASWLQIMNVRTSKRRLSRSIGDVIPSSLSEQREMVESVPKLVPCFPRANVGTEG